MRRLTIKSTKNHEVIRGAAPDTAFRTRPVAVPEVDPRLRHRDRNRLRGRDRAAADAEAGPAVEPQFPDHGAPQAGEPRRAGDSKAPQERARPTVLAADHFSVPYQAAWQVWRGPLRHLC